MNNAPDEVDSSGSFSISTESTDAGYVVVPAEI